MKLNNIIIHEVLKETARTSASVDLSSNTLEIDDTSVNLIKELNDRYIKLNNTYAVFGNDVSNSFPADFCKFYTNKSNECFLDFSITSIQLLRSQIAKIAPAKGGYLVFADYDHNGSFFGIFLIRNTKGVLFKKDKHNFIINPQIHIDLERLAMACRINMDQYFKKEGRYLSFIKKKNEVTSEYFINWICADDRIDNRTDTKNLYNILANIDRPMNEEGIYYSKDDFLKKTHDFIFNKPNKIVSLKELSKCFYSDENIINEYAHQHNIQINSEFKADSQVLKKFVKIKLKADDIEISFPPNFFKEKITINENKELITINSPALAKKIIAEFENNDK